MRKLSILIACVLVVPGLSVVPPRADALANPAMQTGSPVYFDELDQKQETSNNIMLIGSYEALPVNIQVAQSFVPTKEVLTRVQLEAGKNTTTTHPLTVSIRQDLAGADLVSVDIPVEEFTNLNVTWVDCDVPDCWVVPGDTYYIVCRTENVTANWFIWAGSNDSTAYPNGCAWISIDGVNWNSTALGTPSVQGSSHQSTPRDDGNGTWDMCFRTYGLTETTLSCQFSILPFMKLIIKNTGNVTAQDLWWNTSFAGGFLLIGNREANGTLPDLGPGNSTALQFLLIGFGKIQFSIQIGGANVRTIHIARSGTLIFIFFIVH